MTASNAYFLITPARNEEKVIEITIQSVISQTIKPVQWSIVSDGSTDRTDVIVKRYAEHYSFIKLFRTDADQCYNASSKVKAFNYALSRSKSLDYGFIGNLDADVKFDKDYFEKILGGFAENPMLGLAGGMVFEEVKGRIKPLWARASINSVSGAVQLFRKECFVSIGGYKPISMGGIDTAAEISVRAKGWTVRTFPQVRILHLKPMQTGAKSVLRAKFRQGRSNYQIGYHPLFQLAVSFCHLIDRPYILAGTALFCGYFLGFILRDKKLLAPDIIKFLRREQLSRLFSMRRG
jgi:Glycosyltransferases, probably involved in cell wall biogenesis